MGEFHVSLPRFEEAIKPDFGHFVKPSRASYNRFALMRLEHYPIEKLKKEILDIVGKYVDLKTIQVFFFGSRVSGKGTDRSDIDVGIEGPDKIEAAVMGNIKDEIESLPTLYTIDIVDLASTTEKFRQVAKQHIKLIDPV